MKLSCTFRYTPLRAAAASAALVLVVCASIQPAAAQRYNDSANDSAQWTIQTPVPDSIPAIVDRPAVPRRACTGDDRFTCQGECRDVFAEEYHNCYSICLAKHCTQPTPTVNPIENREGQRACLEENSQRCDRTCVNENTDNKEACRRDCLSSKCPGVSRVDASREAMSPGSTQCKRCRGENERRCARRCDRVQRSDQRFESALSGMACEQMCISTTCGPSCAIPGGM
jgi:hypothetical protein